MSKLTLRILKNTDFPKFYMKFIKSKELFDTDKIKVLKIAVILMNTDDEVLYKLGYRMILKYTNLTGDYIPLYDVAINKGYIPIAKYIEEKYLSESNKGNEFLFQFISSFGENFRLGDIYLTEEQLDLNNFFNDHNDLNLSVVAPTSYGKSELIMSCIDKNPNSNICILVPTKSLLAQTKRRILGSKNFDRNRKIITHPEMYSSKDRNFVAVLTQERMLRLLQYDAELFFDFIVVDEAHNLLNKDSRARLLASSLIILNYRNRDSKLKFLTPFMLDTSNLNVSYTNINRKDYKVNENIKSENYYYYNFHEENNVVMYDQFLNEHYIMENREYLTDIELIKDKSSEKNVIYLNKPSNIEAVSKRLLHTENELNSDMIERAVKDIGVYIHKEYSLIKCLRKGFIYHHGSVPDNIRLYIEHLFSTIPEIRYIITSSTLLEGVNIPADKIFLLENKKGRSALSHAQFKNLVGRVSRFSDIFNRDNGSLRKLEPSIYLIKSEYMARNANIQNFLERTVKIDKNYNELAGNVLLDNTDINEANQEDYLESIRFIENQEHGATGLNNAVFASTEIGQICYKNSIVEFDILKHEHRMQIYVDILRSEDIIINSHNDILKHVTNLFITRIESNGFNNLKRLEEKSARSFYSMFIMWKIKQASYNEMISSFVHYWNKIISKDRDTTVYVGKWGDITRKNALTGEISHLALWTDIAKKTKNELINLAIVRIKEEQDFLENNLMKFIEALYELELLDKSLYLSIKYGTDDNTIITLIKNGIGLQTSKLLILKYSNFLAVDVENSTISIDKNILNNLRENDENQVVIYEVACSIGQ